MKRCVTCKQEKPFSDFHKNKSEKDGYHSQCKQCRQKYSEINSERIKKYSKKYYRENLDKERLRRAVWREKNRAPIRRKSRKNNYAYRLKALEHISNGKTRCEWCGIDFEPVLTIDHVFNDGSIERKEIHNGTSFYLKVFTMDKEEAKLRYQVLCRNCNWLKRLTHLNNEYLDKHLCWLEKTVEALP